MADAWQNAGLALRLLALDPGLGGMIVRARAGPVRDAFAAALHQTFPSLIRLHPGMTDEALLGGLDLTATLAAGHVVERPGLLAQGQPLLLTMAERTTPAFAGKLAAHLDSAGGPLILFDEGVDADETVPDALAERVAFCVDLSEVRAGETTEIAQSGRGAKATHSATQLEQIVTAAAHLGIHSMRAPTFALRAATAHAAMQGNAKLDDDDVAAGCALVFAHRATVLPEDPPPPPPPQDDTDNQQASDAETLDLPTDMILEAVRALLPSDLLDQIKARRARAGRGSGSGAAHKGNRRGRPLPSRAGRRSSDARIDLVATLRAAAPWQTIRRRETGRAGLHIRASDIQSKRFEEKSDRLLIFAVDASGSAALARLAEAKGAVELLLAQAYARRDHVALIAFRGTGAELLLPPTRSLVQTKRRLAALPGGGGTPLASGLQLAMEQAGHARRRGLTPTICLLTDGRANIARDGSADRARAADDAQSVARMMLAEGIDALVIDTGNRPSSQLRTLAQTLDGTYLPMPRADASRLSSAVSAALES